MKGQAADTHTVPAFLHATASSVPTEQKPRGRVVVAADAAYENILHPFRTALLLQLQCNQCLTLPLLRQADM